MHSAKFKKIWEIIGGIIRRYPMVIAMAAIGALAAVDGVKITEGINYEGFEVTKFAFTACLGISLMFGIKMLSQRIGNLFIMQILGLILLGVFYFVLPDKEKEFTDVYAFVLIPVFILSHLLVSFAPFINQKNQLKFWQYNKNLFINIVLTGLFIGVLVGGVLLAIVAVEKLFSLNLDGVIYRQTFFFLAILGSCFIFLLFCDKGLPTLENDEFYPEILKFFTQFILIPLLLIYAVILYLYSFKILINWELPRGWVSYLILAYSIVGILALLLVYPLKAESSKSWVKWFSKIFYYTLLPLMVLLFTAIFTRILEYGYTEARYFVLLLALWLTAVVLYFVFSKKDDIKFIPLSLFIFGSFALVCPYLNAFSTAKRSQKHELKEILTQNKLLKSGEIDFNKKIKSTVADEIANKISFLAERKEVNFLIPFIGNNPSLISAINKMEKWNVRGLVKDSFKNVQENSNLKNRGFIIVSDSQVLPVSNYDFVVNLFPNQEFTLTETKEIISMNSTSVEDYIIELKSANRKAQYYNLMPFLKKMVEHNKSESADIKVPSISHEFDLGTYHFRAYFKSINSFENNNGKEQIIPQDITLLIRKK